MAFYEGQHVEALRIEQALARVADVVQRASLVRYVQLASMIETRVIAPLLEALYHETLRSAQAGYDFFCRWYVDYETTGRLTGCESFLNATHDYLEPLPHNSARATLLNRLQYWQARLALGLSRYAEAEATLRELLPHIGDDAELQDQVRELKEQNNLQTLQALSETQIQPWLLHAFSRQSFVPLLVPEVSSIHHELHWIFMRASWAFQKNFETALISAVDAWQSQTHGLNTLRGLAYLARDLRVAAVVPILHAHLEEQGIESPDTEQGQEVTAALREVIENLAPLAADWDTASLFSREDIWGEGESVRRSNPPGDYGRHQEQYKRSLMDIREHGGLLAACRREN